MAESKTGAEGIGGETIVLAWCLLRKSAKTHFELLPGPVGADYPQRHRVANAVFSNQCGKFIRVGNRLPINGEQYISRIGDASLLKSTGRPPAAPLPARRADSTIWQNPDPAGWMRYQETGSQGRQQRCAHSR